ncbi:hypothetical protein [Microcoleus sp. CAWBG58]|uniref:hypothetical protein n=1 Tax=Microcoleus sp. CAWBG58 TaxID=2841651 RepID=UPI0025CDF57E|nr:hypothetical protein [Microcoleus sp. CAWBG58]
MQYLGSILTRQEIELLFNGGLPWIAIAPSTVNCQPFPRSQTFLPRTLPLALGFL